MSVAVVVPNHLPHLDFLREWHELREVPIIVVQDSDAKVEPPEGFDVQIFTHEDIANDLGENSWIIPKQTSACRSYGYLQAYRQGYDYILTLDNDCYPDGSEWVQGHLNNLTSKVTLDWVPSAGEIKTRGFPYGIRNKSEVWLSHGLWSGVPDFDAPTQLLAPDIRFAPATATVTIPRWNFFPMCAMNLGWRRELTPAMYFGLFGPDYGFDQYDDIWAGVLVKRVLDHLGQAAVSGSPSVEHRKQSNVYANLRKQAPGMEMNENFWRLVASTHIVPSVVTDQTLYRKTTSEVYLELLNDLPDRFTSEPEGWTAQFKEAACIWLSLFDA